jgi:hypothetical protein
MAASPPLKRRSLDRDPKVQMRMICIAAIACLTACAHFWTPAPDVPQSLKASDNRHLVTGTWKLTLTVDSLRSGSSRRDTLPQVRVACLYIADSIASPQRSYMLAVLQPSFGQMVRSLYRIPSSVGPQPSSTPSSEEVKAAKRRAEESSTWPLAFGGHAIDIQHRGDRWSFVLTPGVFDYYVGFAGRLFGDSLTGTWHEESQGQTESAGRFTMRPLETPRARSNPRLQRTGHPSAATPCTTGAHEAEAEH